MPIARLRRIHCFAAAMLVGFIAAAPAQAQFRVEISGVGATQLPIAITKFRDEERSAPSTSVSGIVRADLERSGVFKSVDAPGALDENSQPAMSEWRGRSADALVVGSVTRLADGRFDIRFKLWDVVKGEELLGGQSSRGRPGRRSAPRRRTAWPTRSTRSLTGEPGRLRDPHCLRGASSGANRFSLLVTDADGEGGQVALASPEPIISPAWSPNGQRAGLCVFRVAEGGGLRAGHLANGERRVLANFRGSNSAPAWSPDGKDAGDDVVARRRGSQLWVMPRRNGGTPRKRLTSSSSAIDTEPVYTPPMAAAGLLRQRPRRWPADLPHVQCGRRQRRAGEFFRQLTTSVRRSVRTAS